MSDKMREDFEAWVDSLTFEQLDDIDENSAWKAWQASRAALVVDLSDLCDASYTSSGTCYKSDVENRLDDAGVSYK